MSRRQIKTRLAMPLPRRMSRRQIKTRLAMPVTRRNKMLLNSRPCAHNPPSRRSPQKQNTKIHPTPARGQDLAKPAGEARAPVKLQNHLEPGAAPLDRRQLPTHLRLRRRDRRPALRRYLNRLASSDNDHVMSLKEALRVVSGEIEHWTPTLKPVLLSNIT